MFMEYECSFSLSPSSGRSSSGSTVLLLLGGGEGATVVLTASEEFAVALHENRQIASAEHLCPVS